MCKAKNSFNLNLIYINVTLKTIRSEKWTRFIYIQTALDRLQIVQSSMHSRRAMLIQAKKIIILLKFQPLV